MVKRNRRRLVDLGRLMTYILGTGPDEFGLVPDKEGYLPIKEFLNAIHEEPSMAYVREDHLREVLLTESDGALEMDGKRIRSTRRTFCSVHEQEEVISPPKTLFAGVKRKTYPHILKHGLSPGSKEYVVMTTDRDLAMRIARRLDDKPIMLEISARRATENGVAFFAFGSALYLAKDVPVQYIHGPALPKVLPPKVQPVRREEELSPGSFALRADRDPDLRRRHEAKRKIGWKEEVRRGRRRKRSWA